VGRRRSAPASKEMEDINNDGFSDIVAFNEQGIHIAVGRGDGTFHNFYNSSSEFSKASAWSYSYRSSIMKIDDVNGDGSADVVGFSLDNIYVSLGDGNGGFAKAYKAYDKLREINRYFDPRENPRYLADLNGDGKADIVVVGEGGTYTLIDAATLPSGENHIDGGAGNDYIYGSNGDDHLNGEAGNDDIHGEGGNDYLYGGDGNDGLRGGEGSDRLDGENGDDYVNGGTGNDTVLGGEGNDTVIGEGGNDHLDGGIGHDNIWAGSGDDVVIGGEGNDLVDGQDGNDVVYGGTGDDRVFGADGDDYLDGGFGADKTYGGNGNDYIVDGADGADDLLLGELGHDKIITINGNNLIDGGSGVDQITGGSGNDIIYGNSGEDIIYGGAGSDVIRGGTNDDLLYGEVGNDHIIGGQGNDYLDGGADDDLLEASDGDDALYGGLGNDYLQGDGGNDIIVGGLGNDYINGGAGSDLLSGSAGDDAYHYDIGHGDDIILEDAAGGVDSIKLSGNIAKDQLIFKQVGANLLISFAGQAGSITIVDQFLNNQVKVEKLEFADGKILSLGDSHGLADVIVTDSLGNINSNAANLGSFLMVNEDDQIRIPLSSGQTFVSFLAKHGEVTQQGDNLIFTPTANYTGLTDFSLSLQNADGVIQQYDLTVALNPINDAPILNLVEAELNEDSSITIDILAGASDIEGSELSFTMGRAKHGTVEISDDNKIIYTPNADYYGDDSFEYSVTDIEGLTTTKTLNIVVNNISDKPVVVDNLAVQSAEDIEITIDVSEYAYDADGDDLTVMEVSTSPENGLARIEDNKIIYTPNANYNGTDSLTYVISDGEYQLTKTINLTISPENDIPIIVNSLTEVQEDGTVIIDILRDVIDADGDDLTISSISRPSNGAAEVISNKIIYVPKANFYGEDSLIYTVDDGNGGYVTRQVDITVKAVNDAPFVETFSSDVKEDNILIIDVLKGSHDIEGDDLSIKEISAVANGVATIVNNKIIYIPHENYNGVDSVEYVISDGVNDVSKTLNINIELVNDLPVALLSEASLNEDSSINIDVLPFASDVDGDALSLVGVSGAEHGVALVVGGKIIYTPNPDYFGADSFEYIISDGNGGVVSKTLGVTINNVNDAPIINVDGVANIKEDQTLTFDVLSGAEDIDGDQLSLTSVDNAVNGVAIISDGKILYTPNENFYGLEKLTYIIDDGVEEVSKDLMINIASVNDAPDAANDQVNVLEDEQVILDLLSNDSDVEDETLRRENVLLGGALHGVVSLNDNNQIIYQADSNYNGADKFSYAVKDSKGLYSNLAEVNINVAGVNDAPIVFKGLVDQMVRAGEESTIKISENVFGDVDGDALDFSIAMADGSALPAWLRYDKASKQIMTNATNDNAGAMNLIITASDGEYQSQTEFTLFVKESLEVRNDNRINIVEGGIGDDLIVAETGKTDLIFAGDGDDDIVYNIDDIWGDGYFAQNSYTGEKISLTGKIRSYDAFDGGKGEGDTLYLTEGNDSIFLDDLISDNPTISGSRLFGIEMINALGGSDVIDLSSNIFTYGSVTINGSDGDDVLWSNDGNDIINGGAGRDNIVGGRGNDVLDGGAGDDVVNGYDGDDTLIGGLGEDILIGGSGKDIFEFTGIEDSVKGKADIIKDFEDGIDLIKITNQNFADFTFSYDADSTFIGNIANDFAIEIDGVFNLTEDDFLVA
jgi:Ca2+-binding RTX toxin-like protein